MNLTPLAGIVLVVLAIVVGVFVVLYLLVPIGKFLLAAIKHVSRFVFGEVLETLRLAGSLITAVVMIPLTLLNVIVGRWSGAAHYGRGFTGELKNAAMCVYRMAIGHPARLLGLTALTEGVEKRLPAMVANAPGSDTPNKRVGQFPGYKIVGSLPGGGSGGKLYVAEPEAVKRASFARDGRADVDQVVIKVFSLKDGSSLPQIVRESRSLDAARKLGLVLDHELTAERFFYVMEYVPGQSLSLVTTQLHAASGVGGLDSDQLRAAMGYSVDLLKTLDQYHKGGLWHKDVKPDNIIVDGARAHLVDFGLVTPLRSAMTLTTHGTEYFRDPELVRMALKGAKVHEVDGTRFDIYAAGAVLYSVIENSFPAHGVLSQITKKCPEAMRWIVRRAMTDYDKRYATAGDMAADLEFVRFSTDPFAVKPIELPSMRGGASADSEPSVTVDPEIGQVAAAHAAGWGSVAQQAKKVAADASKLAAEAVQSAMGAAGIAGVKAVDREAPSLKVTNWWTGKYEAVGESARVNSPISTKPLKGHVIRRVAELVSRPGGISTEEFMNELGYTSRTTMVAALRNLRDNYGITTHISPDGRIQVIASDQPAEMARAGSPVPPRAAPFVAGIAMGKAFARVKIGVERRPAAEQLARARGRVESARQRISERMEKRRLRPRARYANGINPGVWVAVLAVPAVLGLVIFAVNEANTPIPAVEEAMGVRVAEDGALWAQGQLPEMDPGEEAADAMLASHGGEASARVVTVPAIVEIGSRQASVQPVADLVSGTALVIVDLPRPLSQEHRSAITRLAGRLEATGLSLAGDYPGNSAPADVIAAQLGTTAEVLAACAGVSSDSASLRERVGRWLAEHPDKADLVVWFRRDASESDAPVQCFVGGPSLDPETPRFETALKRFHAGVAALR